MYYSVKPLLYPAFSATMHQNAATTMAPQYIFFSFLNLPFSAWDYIKENQNICHSLRETCWANTELVQKENFIRDQRRRVRTTLPVAYRFFFSFEGQASIPDECVDCLSGIHRKAFKLAIILLTIHSQKRDWQIETRSKGNYCGFSESGAGGASVRKTDEWWRLL